MVKKTSKDAFWLIAMTVLIYFNLAVWHSAFLGWALLVIYILTIGEGGSAVLSKFFNFSHRALRTKVLGAFLGLMFFGFFASAAIATLGFTVPVIAAVFFINGLVFSFFKHWAGEAKRSASELENLEIKVLEEVPQSKVGFVVLLVLIAYGFNLLVSSATGSAVASPWQVISPYYIFVFGLAVLVLGLLIFSEIKAKTVIFMLILLSLLLHAYLPLTHKLLYGADGWRHIASENQILEQGSLHLVSYAQNPGALVQLLNPGQYSYGQLWGLTAALSKLLNLDLIVLNAWLVPMLWSIILPILLFELGMFFGWGKKESLFFAWLGFLPFAWQAGGSFSLPVSLGFPLWLLLTLLLLKHSRESRREQAVFLAIFGLASFFGYFLYFLIFWWSWLLLKIYPRVSKIIFVPVSILATAILIPAFELFARYSSFGAVNFFSQIKQFIGNLIAYYLASGPRPHDIPAGNIIFNQTPAFAFVANFLTQWRWWLVIFMVVFLALAVWGFIIALKKKETEYYYLCALSAGLSGGYFISRYLLSGENILARRLEPIFAFFLLALMFIALRPILNHQPKEGNAKFKFYRPIYGLVLSVLVFSAAITASYSLGPDTYAVSTDEYDAAVTVWRSEKGNSNFCVLGSTYPLLALEAVSAKKIVGGGWPINEYFAQPELENYYSAMIKNPSAELWQEILRVQKTDRCYLIAGVDDLTQNDFVRTQTPNIQIFGRTVVWQYTK